MSEEPLDSIDLRTATGEEIRRLMNLGVAEALRSHKAAGVDAVIWDREHDRVVLVPADEIEIPEEAPAEPALVPNET